MKVEPLMGRMVIELIKEDKEDALRQEYVQKGWMSKDSVLELAPIDTNANVAPMRKGKIVYMSKDCFGEAFAQRYGQDTCDLCKQKVTLGSVVLYVPYQDYKVDLGHKYGILADNQIIAIESDEVEYVG